MRNAKAHFSAFLLSGFRKNTSAPGRSIGPHLLSLTEEISSPYSPGHWHGDFQGLLPIKPITKSDEGANNSREVQRNGRGR